jgi:ketosteroid isomerase-like protein
MHPNEKVLRDADDASMRGDTDAVLAAFSDDIVVHVTGRSSLAGVYEGKDQFLGFFRRFMERTPGFTFKPHAYLADDEHGIILQRSHFERGDETVDSNDTFVCHFHDGKVSELWITREDAYAVDAFLG